MKKMKYLWSVPSVLLVGSAIAASEYQEAPELAKLVQAGKLPPVEKRLPSNPLVVTPVEKVGKYGGVWRSALKGAKDSGWLIRTQGYEGLVSWDRKWQKVIPNIASSWKVKNGGRDFIFKLRSGMKWSNGLNFTAEDIAFAVNDVLAHPQYPGPTKLDVFVGEDIAKARVVDRYTVEISFKNPKGLFLQQLANVDAPALTMYSKEYCKQFHPKYNKSVAKDAKAAGFDSWAKLFAEKCSYWDGLTRWSNHDRPTVMAWTPDKPYAPGASIVTMKRNPYYFKVDTAGNQLPYMNGRSMIVSESVDDIVLKVMNGEIDFMDRHIAKAQNKALFFDNQKKGNYKFFNTVTTDTNLLVLMFNQTHDIAWKREVFNQKDFRIALSLGINRQEIVDTVLVGQGEPNQVGPRKESDLYHKRIAKQYTEYDPDKANSLLDKLGFKKGSDGIRKDKKGNRLSFDIYFITVFVSEWPDMLEMVAQHLQEVGIELKLKPVEMSRLEVLRKDNKADALVWKAEGGLDPYFTVSYIFPNNPMSSYGIKWWRWFMNPNQAGSEEPPVGVKKQMNLYRKLLQIADPDAQAKLFKQILDASADEFRVIGIATPAGGYGIVKNTVGNVPKMMPHAWTFPAPGPIQTSQIYFK